VRLYWDDDKMSTLETLDLTCHAINKTFAFVGRTILRIEPDGQLTSVYTLPTTQPVDLTTATMTERYAIVHMPARGKTRVFDLPKLGSSKVAWVDTPTTGARARFIEARQISKNDEVWYVVVPEERHILNPKTVSVCQPRYRTLEDSRGNNAPELVGLSKDGFTAIGATRRGSLLMWYRERLVRCVPGPGVSRDLMSTMKIYEDHQDDPIILVWTPGTPPAWYEWHNATPFKSVECIRQENHLFQVSGEASGRMNEVRRLQLEDAPQATIAAARSAAQAALQRFRTAQSPTYDAAEVNLERIPGPTTYLGTVDPFAWHVSMGKDCYMVIDNAGVVTCYPVMPWSTSRHKFFSRQNFCNLVLLLLCINKRLSLKREQAFPAEVLCMIFEFASCCVPRLL
jgi:hypothetical protein